MTDSEISDIPTECASILRHHEESYSLSTQYLLSQYFYQEMKIQRVNLTVSKDLQ